MNKSQPTSIVAEIDGKISELQEQKNRIQNQCAHPADAMHYVSGSIEGDAPGQTAYYRNCHCRLCDKRWTEDV